MRLTTARKMVLAAVLGCVVMAAAGSYYGYWAQRYSAISDVKLLPAVPLDNFPMSLDPWEGREVPISDTVLRVAGNDDHLSRVYFNAQMQASATVYVGYTAEPRRMLGHRPRVCYVASGWVHDYTEPEMLKTAAGNQIEVLIHRFYRPVGLADGEVFVLNYYYVNGELTTDHRAFSSLKWRRPKDADGRLQYVAQVQVSSASEQAIRLFASRIADLMGEYMPPKPQNR